MESQQNGESKEDNIPAIEEYDEDNLWELFSDKKRIYEAEESALGISKNTSGSPTLRSGILKCFTFDFIVREIDSHGKIVTLDNDWLPEEEETIYDGEQEKLKHMLPEYLEFVCKKDNCESFFLIDQIAKRLGIPTTKVQVSGIKDKRAITYQKIQIPETIATEFKKTFSENPIKGEDYHVKFGNFEYTEDPKLFGDHYGNNFNIVLRNIKPIDPNLDPVSNFSGLNDELQQKIQYLRNNGFINYFGTQRFGTGRFGTHVLGKYMIRRRFDMVIVMSMLPKPIDTPDIVKAREIFWSDPNFPYKTLLEATNQFPDCCVAEKAIAKGLLAQFTKVRHPAESCRDTPIHDDNAETSQKEDENFSNSDIFNTPLTPQDQQIANENQIIETTSKTPEPEPEEYFESMSLFSLGFDKIDFEDVFLHIPKQLRQLFVNAYVSYVWNCCASKRHELNEGLELLQGDLVLVDDRTARVYGQMKDYPKTKEEYWGEDNAPKEGSDKDESEIAAEWSTNEPTSAFFSTAQQIEAQKLEEKQNFVEKIHTNCEKSVEAEEEEEFLNPFDDSSYGTLDLVLPIPGTRVRLPQNEIGDYFLKIMEKDGISMDDFRAIEHDGYIATGYYRSMYVIPENICGNLHTHTSRFKRFDNEAMHDEDFTWNCANNDIELLSQNPEILKEKPENSEKIESSLIFHNYSNLDDQKRENFDQVSNDEIFSSLELNFNLPSGSFATVLLKEFTEEALGQQNMYKKGKNFVSAHRKSKKIDVPIINNE